MSPEARERSFDELTRGLASGSVTRGKALRLMGAAVVGGALASLGIDGEAAAAPGGCKRNGKHCTRNDQCCSGNCDDSNTCAAACVANGGTCSTSTDCCSGNCSNGFCCAPGRVGLSNGTCAKPCSSFAECDALGTCSEPTCSGDVLLCRETSGSPSSLCATHSDCPRGQLCAGSACWPAC
jgi:hypothetical protein